MFILRMGATGAVELLLQPANNSKPRTGRESKIEMRDFNFISTVEDLFVGGVKVYSPCLNRLKP